MTYEEEITAMLMKDCKVGFTPTPDVFIKMIKPPRLELIGFAMHLLSHTWCRMNKWGEQKKEEEGLGIWEFVEPTSEEISRPKMEKTVDDLLASLIKLGFIQEIGLISDKRVFKWDVKKLAFCKES